MHVVATAGHVDHGKSALVRALTGQRPRSSRGGAPTGSVDPARLRVDLAARGRRPGVRRRTRPRAVHLHDARRRRTRAGRAVRGRRRRPVDAPGSRAPRRTGRPARPARGRGGHPQRPRRSGARGRPGGGGAAGRRRCADPPSCRSAAAPATGLDELRTRLVELVQGLPEADPGADVRLWIDRRFTISGAGTVVTGTLPAGTVTRGDTLSTGLGTVRVRGIESLEEKVDSMSGVARVALNLTGDVADLDVTRTLTTPDAFHWTEVLDVRVTSGDAERLPTLPMLHVGAHSVSRPLPAAGRRARAPHPRTPASPTVRRPDAAAGSREPAGLGSARPRSDAACAAPTRRGRRACEGTRGRDRGAGPRLRGGAARGRGRAHPAPDRSAGLVSCHEVCGPRRSVGDEH